MEPWADLGVGVKGGRGAWGSGPAQCDIFENRDGKMVHSDAIWSEILKLQRKFWEQGSVQSDTTCNDL